MAAVGSTHGFKDLGRPPLGWVRRSQSSSVSVTPSIWRLWARPVGLTFSTEAGRKHMQAYLAWIRGQTTPDQPGIAGVSARCGPETRGPKKE